jgi:hypothetical protein
MTAGAGWTPRLLAIAGVVSGALLVLGIALGTLTDHAFETPADPNHEGQYLAVSGTVDSFDRTAAGREHQ